MRDGATVKSENLPTKNDDQLRPKIPRLSGWAEKIPY